MAGSVLTTLTALFIVLLGSAIQRVTGMGLALVASPFLVLVLGTDLGIQTVQVVGLGVCALSAWQLRASINWRRAGVLLACAVVGLAPGTWVVRVLPPAWLSVVIGAVTVLALLVSAAVGEVTWMRRPVGGVAAGAASGFMNVTAGVGGPPVVVYARSIGWEYSQYVATVQLYFTGLNGLSLAGRGMPALSVAQWCAVAAAAGAGLLIGQALAGRISEVAARRVIFVVAMLGSVTTLVRGVGALVG